MKIGSMKQMRNQLSKVEHGFGYSMLNKRFWKNYYFDMFVDLAINSFEWHNLPKGVDPYYLERSLCFVGFAGMFDTEDYGLIVQRGAMGQKLNIYGQPQSFNPTTPANIILPKKELLWYSDIEPNPDGAVIIPNTYNYQPTVNWLDGFTDKLAEIEHLIQLNRNAQATPYIILTNDKELLTMKNLFNKIANGDPVIYLNEQKDTSNQLEPIQLKDRVTVLKLDAPYLLDKLADERDRVISQVLTHLGLNSIAIDKAERLTSAEATSNNGLLQAQIQRRLQPRKNFCTLANRHFESLLDGKEIEVTFNSEVAKFNLETVNGGENIDGYNTTNIIE